MFIACYHFNRSSSSMESWWRSQLVHGESLVHFLFSSPVLGPNDNLPVCCEENRSQNGKPLSRKSEDKKIGPTGDLPGAGVAIH
jgi:hypothetical protein